MQWRAFGSLEFNVDTAHSEFKEWLVSRIRDADGRQVHLIAHSFGTFLTGEAIRDEETSKLSRVLLVGSVLPRKYRWAANEDSDALKDTVNQVRNECGGRDPVAILIRLFEAVPFVSRLFGDSGGVGFDRIEGSNVIHHVENSLEFCEECVIPENIRVSRVHNIVLPTFRHSDAFAVKERTVRFWLPFLLGIEPWEYWDFRRLCAQADQYEGRVQKALDELAIIQKKIIGAARQRRTLLAAGATPGQIAEAERQIQELEAEQREIDERCQTEKRCLKLTDDQLANRRWVWTELLGTGVTLEEWIWDRLIYYGEEHVRRPLTDSERTDARLGVGRMIRVMCSKVAIAASNRQVVHALSAPHELRRAGRASSAPLPPGDEVSLRLTLDPRVAIDKAIEVIGPQLWLKWGT